MAVYIIILSCIFFILFLLLNRSSHSLYLRDLLLPFSCFIFILLLILFSRVAVAAALKGIHLWINVVFPSLFPFFVASELLYGSDFIMSVGRFFEPVMRPLFNIPGCGSFAFIMGITSGYPVGAKITVEMKKKRLLSKTEAERLLTFSNNSGPLFVMGAVSTVILRAANMGFFLLSCHITAGITTGLIFKFYKRGDRTCGNTHSLKNSFQKRQKTINFGLALGNAIKNSVMTLLSIGGFITLFSVIIGLLLETGVIDGIVRFISTLFHIPSGYAPLGKAIISGFIEITSGTAMAGSLENIPLALKLGTVSMIMGWGGLSVHSQVFGIAGKSGISLKPYILGKLIQGFLALFYTLIGIKIAGPAFFGSEQVFSFAFSETVFRGQNYWVFSFLYLIIALIMITVMFICSYIVYMPKNRKRDK